MHACDKNPAVNEKVRNQGTANVYEAACTMRAQK